MNTDKYILQEVTTSAQEREWLDLPKKIYKGNRNWVCPLDQDITEVFDPARNELFADGEAVRWVVRNKAGEVVGRIAAFYNREKAAISSQAARPAQCVEFGFPIYVCSALQNASSTAGSTGVLAE